MLAFEKGVESLDVIRIMVSDESGSMATRDFLDRLQSRHSL